MVKEHPIICPHCKKDTGMTQEQFMFYVMEHDILCPHCNALLFKANKIEY